MKNKRIILVIFAVSAFLSISLGMLDHETESLVHLLTSDGGNIVALIFFTLFFATLGFLIWGLVYLFGRLLKTKQQ